MKIVAISIGALVTVVVLVIIIGLLLPKTHTASRSALFSATPAQLFVLMDGPQTWRSNLRHYESVSAPDGRRQWRETDARGETITYEAVERRPPSLLKTRIVTADLPYSGTWTLTLEAVGGATRVRITEQGEVYNPLFRFVSRFVIGETRTIDGYLRDLGWAVGEDVEIQD
jgi:hypothetical protein